MTTRQVVSFAVAAALVALVVRAQDADTRPTLREAAAGVWGFEAKGASCKDNPHTISFSPDGTEMTLRYSKSFDESPPVQARYKILADGEDYLRMSMYNEDRKTDSGELVVWDLLMLSYDSYCWHRTDWSENGCTQPASRCPPEAK